MSKLFLLLFCGALAVSCVDNDYDLTDIDTNNVTIGGDESEFRIPLATIRVGMNQIAGAGQAGDIRDILREADTWLPATLPGGAAWAYRSAGAATASRPASANGTNAENAKS